MGLVSRAAAQETPNPRQSGADAIRQRQLERATRAGQGTRTYWAPMQRARAGQCTDTLPELHRLAARGRGYENAQHVLGLCLLDAGNRDDGLVWISRAADAGLADAQATHLRLYAVEGETYLPHDQAAQWLYLYQTNPLRLRVGAAYALTLEDTTNVRDQIPRDAYLRGLDMARNWTPRFWSPATAIQ